MNEKNKIKSYNLTRNDNGTYELWIETDAFRITYDNVDVSFLSGEIISFPIRITAKDENNNIIFNWDLTPNTTKDNSEDSEPVKEN